MKLHNKKTGEIVDVESLGHEDSLKEKYGYQVTLSWKTEYDNLSQCKDYNSLAEINEEWEDYTPKEPLIKDEKIRKAVRAFSEVIQEKKYILVIKLYERGIAEFSNGSCFWMRVPVSNETMNALEDRTYYTIDELCGEEEG